MAAHRRPALPGLDEEHRRATDACGRRDAGVLLGPLPLAVRVPSLPDVEPGTRVRLALDKPDLIERTVACTWRETLGRAADDAAEDGQAVL